MLENNLQELMSRMEKEGATEDLRKERLQVTNNLWKEYRTKELMWLQKSRIRWLREGDRNSSFFHKQCKARESRNSLDHLLFNGTVLEDPENIKAAVFSHFKSFFNKGQRCKARLNCPNLAKLSPAQRTSLERNLP